MSRKSPKEAVNEYRCDHVDAGTKKQCANTFKDDDLKMGDSVRIAQPQTGAIFFYCKQHAGIYFKKNKKKTQELSDVDDSMSGKEKKGPKKTQKSTDWIKPKQSKKFTKTAREQDDPNEINTKNVFYAKNLVDEIATIARKYDKNLTNESFGTTTYVTQQNLGGDFKASVQGSSYTIFGQGKPESDKPGVDSDNAYYPKPLVDGLFLNGLKWCLDANTSKTALPNVPLKKFLNTSITIEDAKKFNTLCTTVSNMEITNIDIPQNLKHFEYTVDKTTPYMLLWDEDTNDVPTEQNKTAESVFVLLSQAFKPENDLPFSTLSKYVEKNVANQKLTSAFSSFNFTKVNSQVELTPHENHDVILKSIWELCEPYEPYFVELPNEMATKSEDNDFTDKWSDVKKLAFYYDTFSKDLKCAFKLEVDALSDGYGKLLYVGENGKTAEIVKKEILKYAIGKVLWISLVTDLKNVLEKTNVLQVVRQLSLNTQVENLWVVRYDSSYFDIMVKFEKISTTMAPHLPLIVRTMQYWVCLELLKLINGTWVADGDRTKLNVAEHQLFAVKWERFFESLNIKTESIDTTQIGTLFMDRHAIVAKSDDNYKNLPIHKFFLPNGFDDQYDFGNDAFPPALKNILSDALKRTLTEKCLNLKQLIENAENRDNTMTIVAHCIAKIQTYCVETLKKELKVKNSDNITASIWYTSIFSDLVKRARKNDPLGIDNNLISLINKISDLTKEKTTETKVFGITSKKTYYEVNPDANENLSSDISSGWLNYVVDYIMSVVNKGITDNIKGEQTIESFKQACIKKTRSPSGNDRPTKKAKLTNIVSMDEEKEEDSKPKGKSQKQPKTSENDGTELATLFDKDDILKKLEFDHDVSVQNPQKIEDVTVSFLKRFVKNGLNDTLLGSEWRNFKNDEEYAFDIPKGKTAKHKPSYVMTGSSKNKYAELCSAYTFFNVCFTPICHDDVLRIGKEDLYALNATHMNELREMFTKNDDLPYNGSKGQGYKKLFANKSPVPDYYGTYAEKLHAHMLSWSKHFKTQFEKIIDGEDVDLKKTYVKFVLRSLVVYAWNALNIPKDKMEKAISSKTVQNLAKMVTDLYDDEKGESFLKSLVFLLLHFNKRPKLGNYDEDVHVYGAKIFTAFTGKNFTTSALSNQNTNPLSCGYNDFFKRFEYYNNNAHATDKNKGPFSLYSHGLYGHSVKGTFLLFFFVSKKCVADIGS